MECTEWRERMSALMDGELPDEDAAPLFGHLGGCRGCRNFYRQLIMVREDLAEVAREPTASGQGMPGRDRPPHHRRHPGPEKGRRMAPLRIPRVIAAVIAIVLVALGGLTTALLLQGPRGVGTEHVIYVVNLPMIQVEATYLSTSNNGL